MPQGSLHQHQSRGNSTVRIAVFAVVALHAVFFAGLLMQGCRPDSSEPPGGLSSNIDTNTPNGLAELGSNYYKTFNELPAVAADFPDTNEVLAPTPSQVEPSLPIAEPTLPVTSNVPDTIAVSETTEYVVVRGDSLYKIAKAHGVTLDAMVQENPNIDPSLIKPGQKLSIPPPALVSSAAVTFEGAQDSSNVYVVKAGDTLTKIAKLRETTVAAIKTANNLRTDRILTGKKLIIPESPSASGADSENN